MVLGCYRYGLFPDGDHTMGGEGGGEGGGAENAERGRIYSLDKTSSAKP